MKLFLRQGHSNVEASCNAEHFFNDRGQNVAIVNTNICNAVVYNPTQWLRTCIEKR